MKRDPNHPTALTACERSGAAILGCARTARVGDRVDGGGVIWSIEECPDFPWRAPRVIVQWADGREYCHPSALRLQCA